MAESTQHLLDRVRKPRVHITYDLELGGAVQKKELPFIVGVISELGGLQEKPGPKIKDRKFVEIDRDNFDKVMSAIGPRVKFQVVGGEGSEGEKTPVDLTFRSLQDFTPAQIAVQIPRLKGLLEVRQRIVDLIAKIDGNDKLLDILKEASHDKSRLEQLTNAGNESVKSAELKQVS